MPSNTHIVEQMVGDIKNYATNNSSEQQRNQVAILRTHILREVNQYLAMEHEREKAQAQRSDDSDEGMEDESEDDEEDENNEKDDESSSSEEEDEEDLEIFVFDLIDGPSMTEPREANAIDVVSVIRHQTEGTPHLRSVGEALQVFHEEEEEGNNNSLGLARELFSIDDDGVSCENDANTLIDMFHNLKSPSARSTEHSRVDVDETYEPVTDYLHMDQSQVHSPRRRPKRSQLFSGKRGQDRVRYVNSVMFIPSLLLP